MATKLFLRNTTTSGIADTGDDVVYDLLPAAGAAADTNVVATAAGGTNIQWTQTSGGLTVAWISGRVPAGSFTLTSTNISVWCNESNMNANAGGRYRVYRYQPGGTVTELGGSPFDDGAEFGTGATEMVWIGNVTDTAFSENDRILVRLFITGAGAMANGFTCTLTFNAADAATGDSFFNIAETVTFKAEDVAITGTLTATIDDITAVATGALTIAGSAAATLDDTTLASASALDIAGALAATLDDVGLTATGQGEASPITGTFAGTIDDIALTATGEVSIAGALSATLDDVTLTAASELALSGSLTAVLDDVTGTLAGALDITAAAAITVDDVTLDAAGQGGETPIIGSLTLTVDDVTSTAAGTLDIVGSLTAALDDVTLQAAGQSGETVILGALTMSVDDVTLTATGDLLLQGSVSQTLDDFSLSAYGTAAIVDTSAPGYALVVYVGHPDAVLIKSAAPTATVLDTR